MKLLLTSAGITNESIRTAFLNLLGKPVAEAKIVVIPTAIYAFEDGGHFAWETVESEAGRGWGKLSILELTALPTLLVEHWLPTVEEADVIMVGGGNGGYLYYWMEQSGLGARLPDLLKDKLFYGTSAGSVLATHSFQIDREALEQRGIYRDLDYDEDAPPNAGGDKTLKLVDFVMRPHLNSSYFPQATLERFTRTAATLDVPMYVIDDETAIQVVDGEIQVISEGEWRLIPPGGAANTGETRA